VTRRDDNRAPTIYDVAREAGLSHQSVSRVLRGVSTTKPDTRERVEAAMRRLGYRPNSDARSLARGRSKRIGVVGYETFQSSTSMVLRGISDVAEAAGYRLEVVSVPPTGDIDAIAAEIEQLNASEVVGVLATSPTADIRSALERVQFRMPVFYDIHGDELSAPASAGQSLAADLAMRHLRDLGHTAIAHVAGPPGWDSAARREAAYRAHMAALGREALVLGRGDWSAASGYRAMSQEVSLADATAVFVANDRMALGVMRALHERGIDVPTDLSIVGIDDIPESAYFLPPLTTVHVDFARSGRVAAQSLISMIESPDAPLPGYPQPTLVPRESTTARH